MREGWPHASTESITLKRRLDGPRGRRDLDPLHERADAATISRAIAESFGRGSSLTLGLAHPLDTGSGTDTPGTSLAMNSAWRTLSSGVMPARTGIRTSLIARGTLANSLHDRTPAA